jgi:hypothetical protein
MKVMLTLIAHVMRYNGSMSIKISDQDRLLYTGKDLDAGNLQIDCEITWPTTVNIQLGNKGKNDTLLNSHGMIIQDKAIEITQVLINNFPIHRDLIDKLFVCQREGSIVDTNENWWAWNGTVKINFDHASPMRYLLSLQNEFAMNRSDWNTHEHQI